nr:MAG TPA: hypothetical protein [Inoviridae sp.]
MPAMQSRVIIRCCITVPLEIGLVCLQMINREGWSLRNCRPSVNTITNGLCRAILTFFGVILALNVAVMTGDCGGGNQICMKITHQLYKTRILWLY